MKRFAPVIALVALSLALAAVPATADRDRDRGSFPQTIPLPGGWQPEGIAAGRGNSLFVGSIPTGAIYEVDARTGRGEVAVPGGSGRQAIGIEVDERNRIWVAGGPTGRVFVYDAKSGRELFSHGFASASTFINDVVVTKDAAYFTDSQADPQRLYVVPLSRGGRRFGSPRTLTLTGDLQFAPGFNLNGIETTPDRDRLIAVQSNTAKLFTISPRSGRTREVDTNGFAATNGDGLLRRGDTLYVVQNRLNRIAVLELDDDGEEAELERVLTDPDFDVPTTVALQAGRLWAVNARFGTPPAPETEYDIVQVG